MLLKYYLNIYTHTHITHTQHTHTRLHFIINNKFCFFSVIVVCANFKKNKDKEKEPKLSVKIYPSKIGNRKS